MRWIRIGEEAFKYWRGGVHLVARWGLLGAGGGQIEDGGGATRMRGRGGDGHKDEMGGKEQ